MNWIRNFSRLFIGIVFVFSGFVKGVDPLGFAYKIDDYFVAYGLQWAEPFSLTLSILLCAFEFSLGVLLLLNVKPKQIAWLTLLIMVYFTLLTLYDAIYNPVPDCGCFGDAIKLTNWQTFYKNIVLIVFAIIVFIYRKQFRTPYSKAVGFLLLIIVPLVFIWFSVHNYRNLPMIDFTAWKAGNKMMPDSLSAVNYYLVYQNKATGETRDFLSNELPWQDTAWMSQWEFKNQRIEDPNIYPAPNFRILDSIGNDHTATYLQQPGYLVLIVSYDLLSPGDKEVKKINDFYLRLYEAGYNIIGLTASAPEEVQQQTRRLELDISWFRSDDTEMKTMVRSNPGLVLLKDAVVIKKWHFRNIPSPEEFIKLYPNE